MKTSNASTVTEKIADLALAGASTTSRGDRLCPLVRWLNQETMALDAERLGGDLGVAARRSLIAPPRLQYFLAGELLAQVSLVPGDDTADYEEREDIPDVAEFPEGSQIRVVAAPNPELDPDDRDAMLRLLDWPPAPPLLINKEAKYFFVRLA